MTKLQITPHPGDVSGSVALMRETAQWLIDAGMPLWSPENLTEEKLTPGLQPSNFLVFKADGEPAAAMILQWLDEVYWPGIPENESGFVHKFCVRRQFAGRGLPRLMIDYAISECGKKSIGFLRLDTDAGRPKLCRLYEGLGFKYAGFVQKGPMLVALYEMKL